LDKENEEEDHEAERAVAPENNTCHGEDKKKP
jgi:hypothetical protein